MTTLVGEVDVALKKASATVKETSATADKVLKDVVAATQTMTTSSNECLTTFESFINKEGKVTQYKLVAHFTVLDTHLASQSGGITTISTTSVQYGEEAQVCLGTTGATPKKVLFRPLDGLAKTRYHELIRAESRGPEVVSTPGE